MTKFNDLIKEHNKKLRSNYKKKLELNIQNEKLHYIAYLINKWWKETDPGATGCISFTHDSAIASLYLAPNQNVSKDVMMFIERINKMCTAVTGAEYVTFSDSYSVDFNWVSNSQSRLALFFYYESGNCERKLIRTDIIQQPVYEIVCK